MPKYSGSQVAGPLAAYFKKQHALGTVVIVISSLRALFPTQLAERFVWYDSVVCSVLVHRAFQVVLELCLMGLVANALGVINWQVWYLRSQATVKADLGPDGSELPPGGLGMYRYTQVALIVMVGLVFGAQVNATLGTLTASSQWYAYAEACWGLGLLALVPSLVYLHSHAASYQDNSSYEQSGTSPATLLRGELVIIVVYLIFLAFDPPAWWSRFLEEERHYVPAVSWEDSLEYALNFRLETHSWSAWSRPAVWETIYRIVVNGKAIFLATGPHLVGVQLGLDKEALLEYEVEQPAPADIFSVPSMRVSEDYLASRPDRSCAGRSCWPSA